MSPFLICYLFCPPLPVARLRSVAHLKKKKSPQFRQLTDLESELNALDTRGYSVLHYTCLHNLGALVPVLLERGADPNLRTGDGRKQVRVSKRSVKVQG